MTVQDLIDVLSKLPPHLEVRAYDPDTMGDDTVTGVTWDNVYAYINTDDNEGGGGLTMSASITWEDPATASYRACELCDHSSTVAGVRVCEHPEASQSERLERRAVVACRASGGFCGPEAKHLTFPDLNPLQPLQTLQRITP